MNKIITIGREFGSGGRELGRRLAEELGIEYYDREILSQIAERTSFTEQYIREVEARLPHPLHPITIGPEFFPPGKSKSPAGPDHLPGAEPDPPGAGGEVGLCHRRAVRGLCAPGIPPLPHLRLCGFGEQDPPLPETVRGRCRSDGG